ncbi:MAG: (2Fe-2S)-binding protein [Tannerella sp.]|nr:(2Fe-2S)-binding protein [Tannerella sp.]
MSAFRALLLACYVLLAMNSCKVEENPIPDYAVYITIDLGTEDKELRAVPSYKEYTSKNTKPGFESVGFGGVLVVHTTLGDYKAFDRACPYEVNNNITVEVDDAILYATCPKCGTKYDIAFGTGAPNGVSKHYLKTYRVLQSGSKLTVRN